MANLILHVGPPKCGSSSIQHYFANVKKPCVQKTRYKLLDPLKISELNCEEPSKSILSFFAELLSDNLNRCDALILSHEYLFQCPYAVRNICIIADSLVPNTYIIGYSRRQSDFLISAYSQWLFRSPDRIKEVATVMEDLKLDSVLFSGLERQIIASIANDFSSARQLSEYSILDWYYSYNNIERLVHKFRAVIKCGVLPGKESNGSLVKDFLEKANLTFHPNSKKGKHEVHENPSFDVDIIEAINNAVVYGFEMPGPHECNDILVFLSEKMTRSTSNSTEFLSHLKSYIDTYFEHSNNQLCRKYDLCKDYFAPSEHIDKPAILDMIIHEGQQRALNYSTIIDNYRILSAKMVELVMKLASER